MTRRWWSQEFAPEGSAAAEGIVKQLGQPPIDPLTLLVREAAQNSADARREDASVVDFRVQIRTLGDEVSAWRHILLPPPHESAGLDVDGALAPDSVVLVVSDRNTVGLGGPVRANRRESAERRSDFVQFLRNVGEASDHDFGGGTYGFGKGVFYRLSRCRTILVDTRTAEQGDQGRRLMGAALGPSWVLDDRRYTGRHWWGRVGEDNVPDPVLGDDATRLAEDLGLPDFSDGRTGTNIAIIGAHLGSSGDERDGQRSRTPQEAATFIRSSILWNLWPKFVPDRDGRFMRFVVGVDDAADEVVSPEDFEEFEPFVESLKEIRAGRGAAYTRVTPPRVGGSFALGVTQAERGPSRATVSAARPFNGPPRHIARMRAVELVVDYVEGPAHPNPDLAYGGVFRASEEADRAFAAAEPPTHDDWVVTGLSGSVRGVVQNARTFVNRQLDERLGFGNQSGGEGRGLGQLASRLSAVIPPRLPRGADGTPDEQKTDLGDNDAAAGRRKRTGSGTDGRRDASGAPSQGRRGGTPRLVGAPTLEVYEGRPFAVARVFVPASAVPRSVTAEASVVLDGGVREAEPPAGAVLPQVIQWQLVDQPHIVEHSATLRLPAGPDSEWWIYATHVADAVVRFRLTEELSGAF